MTSFYYYDQNPSGFCFLELIRAFVIQTSLGLQNFHHNTYSILKLGYTFCLTPSVLRIFFFAMMHYKNNFGRSPLIFWLIFFHEICYLCSFATQGKKLKQGTSVMLIYTVSKSLVNGSPEFVNGFSTKGYPVVSFGNSSTIMAKPVIASCNWPSQPKQNYCPED